MMKGVHSTFSLKAEKVKLQDTVNSRTQIEDRSCTASKCIHDKTCTIAWGYGKQHGPLGSLWLGSGFEPHIP